MKTKSFRYKSVTLMYLMSAFTLYFFSNIVDAQAVDAAPAGPTSSSTASTDPKAARKAANTAAAAAVQNKATQSGDTHGNAVSPSQSDAAAEAVPIASAAPGGNDVTN